MSTATEILMRSRQFEAEMAPVRRMLDEITAKMFRHVFDSKAPLIRYGRRKRRYRRLFPPEIAAMRINVDGTARLITTAEFYKRTYWSRRMDNWPTGAIQAGTVNGIPVYFGQPFVVLPCGKLIHLTWK